MAKRRPIDFEITASGCFVCTSHGDDGKGYRRLGSVLMHRFVYEECYGPIPEGLVLRHKCDNRACINPEHLETGTRGDNANDMKVRGRANKPTGIENNRAKLTEKEVIEIYERANSGDSGRMLAREFGISTSVVSKIKRGQNWTHLTKGGFKEWNIQRKA